MDSLTLLPIISPFWLTLIFLGLSALLLVRPSFKKLARSRLLTLNLLRAGAILLALLAALRPGCVKLTDRSQEAVVMVLLDLTRSMELPHINDAETRFAAMKAMLNENAERFQKLAENKIDVRVSGFGDTVSALEVIDGQIQLPDQPGGSQTDLGTPIFKTGIDARGERLIAMLLASDGMQTSLSPEVEMSQAVDVLKDLEVPLYSIAFGLPGDRSQLADVAIKNFAEQHVVNVKNKLNASATLVARGYQGRDIRVQLVLVDKDGSEKEVGQPVFVRPESANDEQTVRLSYQPDEPGEFRIKVRASPMPGEQALRNNELDAFLTVNDKGMRVMYVNGSLGFEQKFLRRSLATADFIEVDFWLRVGDQCSKRDLDSLQKAFSDETYDVFILDDVDAGALGGSSRTVRPLQTLAKAVEGGKGLIMLGGTHSFGAGGYSETALADVLPVVMSRRERQPYRSDVRRELHINRQIKLAPTRNHALTRLGDEGLEAWKMLPPLAGANRFQSIKDSAQVLLQTDDDARHPVMVATNVGGRVLALAADSTQRWNFYRVNNDPKQRTFKQEYDQFWRQIILWLAYWDSKIDELVSIDLPQRRFQARSKVKFGVTAKAVTGQVVTNIQFTAKLTSPNGEVQPVQVLRSGDTFFGELDRDLVANAGLYEIEVVGMRDGQPVGESKRDFVVMDQDKEKSNPIADPERLLRLSNETKKFGGKVIDPDELSAVLDEMIDNPPVSKVTVPSTRRLGDTAIDASVILISFTVLLGVEWFLRKKWELV